MKKVKTTSKYLYKNRILKSNLDEKNKKHNNKV